MAKAGERYAFKGDSSIGGGNSGLHPGTKVTVRETVAAGEKGAHDGSEAAVVIVWDAPTIVHTENGNEVGTAERALAVPASSIGDLFRKES